MFSPDQKAVLGLRRETPTMPSVNGRPTAGCVWLSGSDLTYGTQTIPVGAEAATTEPSASVVQVNGFGAVRTVLQELTGGAPTCQVIVDAADENSVRVQVRGSTQPRRSDDEMCRLATDAASMVMTTVVGAAGG